LDYFSEVSEVCKVLIKLISTDYVTDLTFSPELITGEAGAPADVVIQHNMVTLISDANKQALK
jgi:hypothetical protein